MIGGSPWLVGGMTSWGSMTIGTFLAALQAVGSMGAEAASLVELHPG